MQPPFDIAADLDTPVSAYLKLKPFKPRFLLESVEGGERLARYSFIGFGDCLEVRLDERGLTIDGRLSPPPQTQAELLSAFRSALARAPQPCPQIPGVPMPGGLVGAALTHGGVAAVKWHVVLVRLRDPDVPFGSLGGSRRRSDPGRPRW